MSIFPSRLLGFGLLVCAVLVWGYGGKKERKGDGWVWILRGEVCVVCAD